MKKFKNLPMRSQMLLVIIAFGSIPFLTNRWLLEVQLEPLLHNLVLGGVMLVALIFFMLFLDWRYLQRIGRLIENIQRRSEEQPLLSLEQEGRDEIDRLSHSFWELDHAVALHTKNLREYQRALDESNIVTRSDLKGRITYANDRFYEVTGYTPDEAIGQPHNLVRHPDEPSWRFKELWETIQAKKTWRGTLKNRKKNGDYYIVDITILPILDDRDEIAEYIAIRHDITELYDTKETLKKQARTDMLTDLGNRSYLIERIHESEPAAIALIDIDRFNEINDFYGHHVGDMVLEEFAHRLVTLSADRFELFRYHGDRFALLAPQVDSETFSGAIRALNHALSEAPLQVGLKRFTIQTTAGVCFEPAFTLLSSAEMAIRYAKKEKLSFVTYSKALGLEKVYEENIRWAERLTLALKQDRIVPFYQPIVNTTTGKVEKYEALARMIGEDEKEIISPFFFIDAAKRSKQYLTLTRTIFDAVMAQLEQTDAQISVNLSLEDLTCEELSGYMLEQIATKGRNRIVLELVESEGIENYEEVSQFIARAKEAGAEVAIDDFGTGYSNFSYLLKLNADYIKIDGSLIKTLGSDPTARSVVETIVRFAHQNGLKTVAEFVADETILTEIKALGIGYGQGFHLGKPAPQPL
jgi:diguanylate cyclase (GGDEF)-like protein/PAS domain S-box-containing protein